MIENIWLKKVWEICDASERMAVKLQIKKGQSKVKVKYPPFKSRLEFIQALQTVLNAHQPADTPRIYRNVSNLFKNQTGKDIYGK